VSSFKGMYPVEDEMFEERKRFSLLRWYRVHNRENLQIFDVSGLTRGICRRKAYALCKELGWELDKCWSERL